MVENTEIQILRKIKKARRGALFFADGFAGIANGKAVNKALERLVKSGELTRMANGIYVRPVEDKILGMVLPNIEVVALAIAKRDKARIVPTGSQALYKLGLSTQIPMNVVYYTDGSPRKIRVGKQIITFKKASAKTLSAIGPISKLAIQALRGTGKGKLNEDELNKIKNLLKKEKPFHLQHDLKLAPVWIRGALTENPKTES